MRSAVQNIGGSDDTYAMPQYNFLKEAVSRLLRLVVRDSQRKREHFLQELLDVLLRRGLKVHSSDNRLQRYVAVQSYRVDQNPKWDDIQVRYVLQNVKPHAIDREAARHGLPECPDTPNFFYTFRTNMRLERALRDFYATTARMLEAYERVEAEEDRFEEESEAEASSANAATNHT